MSKVNKSVQNKAEGLIPTLRFPEFKNEGEWIAKVLEDYIDLFSGIALKNSTFLYGFRLVQRCCKYHYL